MGGFKVDTDAVRGLGDELAQISADLVAAAKPSDLSDGAAGSRAVGQALREFHEHWNGQQQTLVEGLNALTAAVRAAADAYEMSDAAVSRAAQSAGGASQ